MKGIAALGASLASLIAWHASADKPFDGNAEGELICKPQDETMSELIVRYRKIGEHQTFTFRADYQWSGQLCGRSTAHYGEEVAWRCAISADEVLVEKKLNEGDWDAAFVLDRKRSHLRRKIAGWHLYTCEPPDYDNSSKL